VPANIRATHGAARIEPTHGEFRANYNLIAKFLDDGMCFSDVFKGIADAGTLDVVIEHLL
jgi:hypothetical protein